MREVVAVVTLANDIPPILLAVSRLFFSWAYAATGNYLAEEPCCVYRPKGAG